MGSAQSSTVTSTITSINENLTNIIQKTANTSSNTCKTNQQVKLIIGETGALVGCGISIGQVASTDCKLDNTFNIQSSSDLTTAITQAIDNSASNSQKSVQDFLATSLSVQQSNTSLSTYLKNVIQTNFTSETINKCFSEASINQNQELTINGRIECTSDEDNINLSQNAQLYILTECIMSSVIDIIKNDTVAVDAINKAVSEQSSEQKGLSDFISSLMSGWALIIFGVLAVLVVGGILVYFLFFGGGDDKNKDKDGNGADGNSNSGKPMSNDAKKEAFAAQMLTKGKVPTSPMGLLLTTLLASQAGKGGN
jgi:hypothetical protein